MCYIKTKEPEDLDLLVATLYRMRDRSMDESSIDFKGDIREPFNDHLVAARAKKLKNLDTIIKTGILLFYQGCRKFIMKQFPGVFKKGSGESGSPVPGMLALVDALSGDDVTKTEEVRHSQLYDVLVRLQKGAEQFEKQKEELKKMKQNGKV